MTDIINFIFHGSVEALIVLARFLGMTSLTAIGQVWVFKMPSDVQVRLYKNNPSRRMPPGYASRAQFGHT